MEQSAELAQLKKIPLRLQRVLHIYTKLKEYGLNRPKSGPLGHVLDLCRRQYRATLR